MKAPLPEIEAFPVAEIATQPEWQVRAKLHPGTVEAYAKAYRGDEGQLPPLSLARIGGVLFVVDGWHRLEAAKRAGLARVDGRIVTEDPQEALWLAAEANTKHGLPLKPREYRKVLGALIRAGKHRKGRRLLSYRDMAKAIGGVVSYTTVRNWVMKDFPRVAAEMKADEAGGYSGAGPTWSKASNSPEVAAKRHLDSFLAILSSLPKSSQKELRTLATKSLKPPKPLENF
ncbi:MAG: ParB/RepB/Spo0J family partition protein [Beijerinckiaceae bacterium]|jgi:hypothetical protein|nr:ParB/RepB/Spo0J family partition protein [Beijerinckiaceae bacterium]